MNNENVTFTWAAGVQNVLFFTITGDKLVIYVPILRYGGFNTLQCASRCTWLLQDVKQSIERHRKH